MLANKRQKPSGGVDTFFAADYGESFNPDALVNKVWSPERLKVAE